jgi:hypothetical protein
MKETIKLKKTSSYKREEYCFILSWASPTKTREKTTEPKLRIVYPRISIIMKTFPIKPGKRDMTMASK